MCDGPVVQIDSERDQKNTEGKRGGEVRRQRRPIKRARRFAGQDAPCPKTQESYHVAPQMLNRRDVLGAVVVSAMFYLSGLILSAFV